MKLFASAAALTAVLSCLPASAQEMFTIAGAPFCRDAEDLRNYVRAQAKYDEATMKALKGCFPLKGNLKG
jgi:hypothetical protein